MPCVHGYWNPDYCDACNAAREAESLRGELAEARELISRHRAMLEDKQWSGWILNGSNISVDCCPECGCNQYAGHNPDCELAALLMENPK